MVVAVSGPFSTDCNTADESLSSLRSVVCDLEKSVNRYNNSASDSVTNEMSC